MLNSIIYFILLLTFKETLASNATLTIAKSPGGKQKLYKKYSLDIKFPEETSIANLEFYGKVCAYRGVTLMYENCMRKFSNYNKYWILLADNIELLSSILATFGSIQEGRKRKSFQVVVNNSTVNLSSYAHKSKPVFIASPEVFNILQSLHIENEDSNYYMILSFVDTSIETVNRFCLYVSILNFSFIILILIWWNVILFKLFRQETTSLQKTTSILPYIKLFLSFLAMYYVKVFLSTENTIMRLYLLTIIETLDNVYKTFFWFLLIIISKGWQILRQNFTRIELRNFILIYIVIYLLVCFDQILDIIIMNRTEVSFHGFTPSDYKNIIMYVVFTIVVLFKNNQSRKLLTRKRLYARLFAREFIRAIDLKQSILKKTGIIGVISAVLSIFQILLEKIFLYKEFNVTLRIVVSNFVEVFLLFFLLFTLRSRRFPPNFNVSLTDSSFSAELDVNFKLYTLHLPSNSDIAIYEDYTQPISLEESESTLGNKILVNSSKRSLKARRSVASFTSEDKKDFEEGKFPFVIVNPFHKNISQTINAISSLNDSEVSFDNIDEANIMDCLSVAYRVLPKKD